MKQNLEKLLKLNQEINSFLKTEEKVPDESFGKLIKQKDKLIENLKKIKNKSAENFENLKNTEFKETLEKIQALEEENLRLIEERRGTMREDINKIKKHVKTISSYKFKKDQEPRLFDDSC